jgi:hypothetical protein
LASIAALALAAAAVTLVRQTVGGPPDAGNLSRLREAIDAETGEVVPKLRIAEGSSYPWPSPRTGQRTMYPAERCYWTKDGKAKLEPTLVLLNEFAGKPGPTICPDCGRTVRSHNPAPPAELLLEAQRASGEGK